MTAVAIPRSTALIEAGREFGKQLSEAEARDLTAQIRVSIEELLPLIRTAYQRRADLALGYASWENYCDAELAGLRMSIADRQEAVVGLRADGMSTRAIGSALGVDPKTVRNDLAQVGTNSPPDAKVVGLDRKEHPAARPATTQTPGPAAAPTVPVAGPGSTPAPVTDAPVPSREPDPEPTPKPTLTLVPDVAQVLAAEQRDARALLSRAADLLAPVNRKPDWADVWVKQFGPYDDELSELCGRAAAAIAVLDDLIERCGR